MTTDDPVQRIETLATSRRQPYRVIGAHLVRAGLDLCCNYPPAATRSDADRQRTKLVRKLRRKGHRVNGNAPTVHHVYVIELDDGVGPKEGHSGKPWLYVGPTSKLIEERITEHRDAIRRANGNPLFSKVADRHCRRARPDLYESIKPVYCKPDAEQLERKTAERLRVMGYSVHQA